MSKGCWNDIRLLHIYESDVVRELAKFEFLVKDANAANQIILPERVIVENITLLLPTACEA